MIAGYNLKPPDIAKFGIFSFANDFYVPSGNLLQFANLNMAHLWMIYLLKMVIGIQTLMWHGEVIWMRNTLGEWSSAHQIIGIYLSTVPTVGFPLWD